MAKAKKAKLHVFVDHGKVVHTAQFGSQACVMRPEVWKEILDLDEENLIEFMDEHGKEWTAVKSGNNVAVATEKGPALTFKIPDVDTTDETHLRR